MKIVVIGAGAMDSIYGGHLSLHNDVFMIDTNGAIVDAICRDGLKIQEYGTENVYFPNAAVSSKGLARQIW